MGVPDDQPHRYRARCRWSGSTGAGYEAYDRGHEATVPPASAGLELSADPAFGGDADRANPEQLLVLAAASCQLLSFLAVAARARVEVLAYADEAVGTMPTGGRTPAVDTITLRPVITVAAGPSEERVRHLVEVAHRECYIANSLRSTIVVEPTVTVDVPSDRPDGSRP